MPQIYHAVPRCGIQGVPLALSLLIEDETNDLLRVFLEYEVRGEQQTLRLLPTDGYRGEEHYSLYSVTVPAGALTGERFAYCFSVEGARIRAYEIPLNMESGADSVVMPPAILPLYVRDRFYLSRGELCLRFLTFPWETEYTRVFVQEKGVWRDHAATLRENGEWECRLPVSLLNAVGDKLCYFVESGVGSCAARLGSEREALSIRLLDDAGPTLTCVCPADGEKVLKNPPDVWVEFEDASGVDLHASAVYLDGRNVGENAVWTANGMSFCPKTPLAGGEHILEIALRDMLGNRTYRRVSFVVAGEDSEDKTAKKPLSTVQAFGFFASAFGTLKKLFSDKE